ncbi:hypothetical protein F5Y19DRAFT_247228 [Xylariaceae sp. FL1651]|nr:hypothetical protein F5Y19DRAFT_247228 [Xylariaceae sp. FL1651]
MSPATLQAARLASRQTFWAPLRQQVFRRSLSSTPSRSARASQPGDWGRIFRSRATMAAIYFPGVGLILGWPLIAKALIDGHV